MATIKMILEDDSGQVVYEETLSKYNTKERVENFPVAEQAREFHDLVKATKVQIDKYYMAIG
ncbi:MAG: hypothetical protein KAJ10_03665 [Thermodesulfovibrionia bacterium]|nr:hypothetical protein [Thermodesulfovibrionia bacterium]